MPLNVLFMKTKICLIYIIIVFKCLKLLICIHLNHIQHIHLYKSLVEYIVNIVWNRMEVW